MADRYWVGGSGNWNATNTTNWSATNGGAGGASVPTASDNVFFTSLSNATGYTVTLATATATCLNITMDPPLTGNVTWAGSVALTVSGSMTISGTRVTRTYTGAITFNSTTSGNTISSGVNLGSAITFNGVGGAWSLSTAINNVTSFTLTNGTLDLNGNTLTGSSFATNNTNVRTLNFNGGNIVVNGTGTVWNAAQLSNLTVSGTPTVNVVSTGSTSITVNNGGTTGANEARSVSFNFTGGTYALGLSTNSAFRNLNFTGYSGTATLSGLLLYGDLTFSSTMTTVAGSTASTLAGASGTSTITSNGINFDRALTLNASGKTWKLLDNFNIGATRIFTVINGTLDLNGKTLSVGSVAFNSGTRTILFNSGTISAASSGTAWSIAGSPPTFTAGTGNGVLEFTAATGKTFAGANISYPATLRNAGAGALTVTGANTFADITASAFPTTITLPASTTTTVSAFSLSGTVAGNVTLNSSSAGTQATLSKSSGTVSASYLTIQDSAATGGATWLAPTGSGNVDSGNNTGWDFGTVASLGNFMAFF